VGSVPYVSNTEIYLEQLRMLDPSSAPSTGLRAVDLFAGCGGLALGFEAAGIETIGYEMDNDAVATYNRNLHGKCVKAFIDCETAYPAVDIVIGGPPCQPFSVGGKQVGLKDSRDGFPAFLHAVSTIKPKLCLFENVRGMMYRNRAYLAEIVARIESLGYKVSAEILKASHYGVPQNRERLFVVGHYGNFRFPKKLDVVYTAGAAVSDLAFKVTEECKILNRNQDKYIAKYEKASKCINPRDLHLDRPARTVTCRNLAGATGDMHRVRLPDGRRKRLSVREGARLQSFPDWFQFEGSEKSQFNQVGNAVPPLLSYAVARQVRQLLLNESPERSEWEQVEFL
jgi:DNA (cytosine-5)-methyltransferase 1